VNVDPNHVKSIYVAASEKLPAERATFLDEATVGDVVQRPPVEALLKAHDNPYSFLEKAVAVVVVTVELSSAARRCLRCEWQSWLIVSIDTVN
jgi:hypothetical protein